MGLIQYEQIEDGNPASGNSLNERFGKLYGEFNGNIDSDNLKNGAVTGPKIATNAVTSDKIDTDRYYDENGWLVNDLGTTKTYSYVYDINGVSMPGLARKDNLPGIKVPTGRTRENLVFSVTWYGGYAGHALPGIEAGATLSDINIMFGNLYSTALTFTGKIFITAVEKL